MAALLKLVYTADFQADQASLDLLDFASGFTLAENGWIPKVATGNQESIIETLTLYVSGQTQDNIASSIHTLEDWIKKVNFSHDSVAPYQVWLRAQDTFETLPRQAMVLEMSGLILDPHPTLNFDVKLSNNNYMVTQYVLTIRRTPFWEDTSGHVTSLTGINCIGGSSVLGASIYGDVPARLRGNEFVPQADGTAYYQNYWAGFRTSRFGVLANFKSVWSLDLSSTLSADTTVAADATAYDGNKLTCAFTTTAADALRSSITLTDISAVPADNRGNYTVLLRAKTDSGSTTVNAYIKYGIGTGQVKRTPITISGTTWKFYEVGTIAIPASNLPLITGLDFSNMGVSLYLQRTSVAGTIDLDCYVMIPIDEASIKGTFSDQYNHPYTLVTSVRADGLTTSFGYFITNGVMKIPAEVKLNQWSIPVNNEAPLLVFAAQGNAAGSVKGKTLLWDCSYVPRYRSLRGNLT